jgi:hypothetical protein
LQTIFESENSDEIEGDEREGDEREGDEREGDNVVDISIFIYFIKVDL